MSKAIQGAAMLGAAVAMGVAAFFDPALIANPWYDKLMASLVLGGISMEAGAIAQALTSNRGTNITSRQPAANRQIIYGEQRVGGIEVYLSTTGSHHDQFNYVIVLAGHEVDSIVNLYLDGRQVYWLGSGTGYSVRNGVGFGGVADNATHIGPDGQHYNFGGTGHSGLYCEARYGDQLPGDVIAALTANDPNWAASGGNSPYLGGCCYVYLKIEYNVDLFPTRPEIRFTVRGKNNIYDPRTDTRGYSKNWALIVADVLEDSVFGLGDTGSVNTTQLIAAANVCDEQVPLAIGGTESRYCCHWHYDTAISPGDVLAQMMPAAAGRLSRIGGEWFIWPAYWQGPSITLDESALTGDLVWEPYRSLRDLSNRVKGTYIAPNSPYNVAGNLYDANGWFNGSIANQFPFGFQPTSYPQYAQDPLHGYANDAFLEEDSGVLGPWAIGTTYNTDDVVVDSGIIYKSLIDSNTGNTPGLSVLSTWATGTTYALGQFVTYLGVSYKSLIASNTGNIPSSSPTDWAATNPAWVAWSNLLPMEVSQNCVLSIAQAQRCAKIMLLRNRQQGSGTFPLHLNAWQMQPLDVMSFTFPVNGWSGKSLEIVSTKFSIEEQDGVQAVRFEALAQETDPSIYAWSTAEELSPYSVPSAPTGLPYTIDAPTALTLSSSSTTAVTGADGVTLPRILATWTAPTDVRVTQIQVQYQHTGAGSWLDAGTVDVATASVYIGGVVSGQTYNVQIRSLSNKGATSAWVSAGPVTATAPNSLKSSYSISPQFALTQPTSTTIAVAAFSATFGSTTVNYAARTLTISAPGTDTWYYITIADPTQQGESGSPTLTATASTSNALVGVQGNTYVGAILAKPAGGATRMLAGGWPAPQTVQVGV